MRLSYSIADMRRRQRKSGGRRGELSQKRMKLLTDAAAAANEKDAYVTSSHTHTHTHIYTHIYTHIHINLSLTNDLGLVRATQTGMCTKR